MEEILASIRKIIAEDESKGVAATTVPPPSPPRPSPSADNVSPLFADRHGPARFVDDRASEISATEVKKTPPADAGKETRADPLPPVDKARAKVDLTSPRSPEPANQRQSSDKRLLSQSTEAAVSESFAGLRTATARADPSAVEQLAERLMRPMVKAWLDENLSPLVERIVREEVERVSRNR